MDDGRMRILKHRILSRKLLWFFAPSLVDRWVERFGLCSMKQKEPAQAGKKRTRIFLQGINCRIRTGDDPCVFLPHYDSMAFRPEGDGVQASRSPIHAPIGSTLTDHENEIEDRGACVTTRRIRTKGRSKRRSRERH